MVSQLRAGFTIFALLTVLTGVVYPAVVTLVAQTVFNHQANGSIVKVGDNSVGSQLIGQTFDDPKYFWSRPSAASYNGGSSSGSNLGPIHPALLDAVKGRIEALKSAHPDQEGDVPVDLVTASASGLDPHISPAAAAYQVKRVAQARGMSEQQVQGLVAKHTQGRQLGVLGESSVNVLLLNLALDTL